MNKETKDQIASIMLQHGTSEQQQEAMRYISDGKVIAALCLKVPLCKEDISALFIYAEKIRAEGFKAGATSREAEVAEANEASELGHTLFAKQLIENDKLRAQINELLDALMLTQDQAIKGRTFPATASPQAWFNAVTIALATTPEQSLAEYRNKVIEAFVNEFSRHVGGDGEFWLHELQDFAMKEQP